MSTIVIVGKPNVGKSTLFNRIVGNRVSIVSDTKGTTRDRIYGKSEWLTIPFDVIDTGGITSNIQDFSKEIEAQVEIALSQADIVMFLCSSKDGVSSDDIYISKMLKRHKVKNVVITANKSESEKHRQNIQDFYSLGFGEPILISAEHGIGVGDLLDKCIKMIPRDLKNEDDKSFRFSIIGRPNVGKSSLVNSILQEERSIVSPIMNTTRDAIDSHFKYHGRNYCIVDTAGIRRKGKVTETIEIYSVLKAQRSLEKSDAVILVIDCNARPTEQDEVIGGLIQKFNLPAIVLANKWDLVADKSSSNMKKLEREIKTSFKYIDYAPVIFASALENKKVNKIFDQFKLIEANLNKKVSTSLLNEVLVQSIMINLPPEHNGGRLNISYATQVQAKLPTFVIFCNNPNYLHFTYSRYLENKIRESFGFDNVPILLIFKPKMNKGDVLDV